jgi:poly-beta-1,6-N-acetyl-D-glucosamine N-deacetylase
MAKFLLKVSLLCFMVMTVAISSLSAFKPKELYRDQVAVLMYHHVHDQDKSSGTITTKLFREQLAYLRSKGYHFISLNQFKDFMAGSPVPGNAVLVTFDDGYESFYLNAYPILSEMNIPAVNFIITGTLDDPKSGNVPFMNRAQASAMYKSQGLIDLECHTDALHDKADGKALLAHRLVKNGQEETPEAYKSRIVGDTKACLKRVGEVFPGNGDALAYPFGIYNEEAAEAVTEGGIRYAFTIMPKMATRGSDPMRIPRINAGSPFIRPEALHNMIMRRVSAVKHPHDTVPLRETVEQIGGELHKSKEDGGHYIRYNGADFRISDDKTFVTDASGAVIHLKQPLKIMGNRSYISINDLQAILNVPIFLDSHTNTYTTKPPKRTDVDTEGLKLPPKG